MFKKIEDLTIYKNDKFYTAFPAIAVLGNNHLIVAFRRAPDHRHLPGAPRGFTVHGDPLSQSYCVHSYDNGRSWAEPKLIFAPPDGGSQDACFFYDGGKYLYFNSFIWKLLPKFCAEELQKTNRDQFVYKHCPTGYLLSLGSYAMRSSDGGMSWEGPFMFDPIPNAPEMIPGYPLRPFNRGNIVRATDGALIVPQQYLLGGCEGYSAVVIYRSIDEGRTWRYFSTAIQEDTGIHEEPRLHITPSGRWVLLVRVHKTAKDAERITRALLGIIVSEDEGKTWSPLKLTAIHSEPATSLRMDDGRALVAYGYRKEPYGVRLRVCEPELNDIEKTEEFIIRDDAERGDTGYPWIAPLGNNHFLIVYYLNKQNTNGPGHIAGTVFEIR